MHIHKQHSVPCGCAVSLHTPCSLSPKQLQTTSCLALVITPTQLLQVPCRMADNKVLIMYHLSIVEISESPALGTPVWGRWLHRAQL